MIRFYLIDLILLKLGVRLIDRCNFGRPNDFYSLFWSLRTNSLVG